MKTRFRRALLTIVTILCIAMLSFCLTACGGDTTGNPPGTTDEMFSDSQSNVQLEVYKKDGHVYTVEYDYEIPELADNDELEDGKNYRLTADVTFLNGGVAGYVDYPQIDRIISIEEIPSDEDDGEEE